MKKRKRLLISFVLIMLCLICFSGCSSVSYLMVQKANGEISQSFSVQLNESVLVNGGYDYETSKQKVKTVLTETVTKLKQRFYLNTQIPLNIRNEVLNKVTTSYPENEQTVSVLINFESVTDYRYFYGMISSGSESSGYDKVEENAFYSKNYTIGFTKFYNFYEDPIYKEACDEMADYFGLEQAFTINDVSFNYCYATPQQSHIYSNADYSYVQDGMKIHIWKMNSQNLDRQVVFYNIAIKPTMWYVVALVLTFVLAGVLAVVIIFKNKKTKKENLVEEKKIKNEEILINNIDFENNSDIINK